MSEPRLLIVAGKGGVGKTTVAAATAAATARRGQRTLVVSLDRAHSLGDVLQAALGAAPEPVADLPGLWAMELDPQVELVRHWAVLQRYLGRFLGYLGAGGAVAEEMAVLPGLEEVLVLARLAELLAAERYDLVVADFAPTASSLRYLSFPDLVGGALGKWLAWDRRVVRALRPLQGTLIQVPLPEEDVYAGAAALARRLEEARALLADPRRTAVRLVMVPESVALEETRRALTYLSLFGLGVDAVVVNRLLPPAATEGYLAGWAAIQARVLARARESFADLPLLALRFQPEEVLGTRALLEVARELYGASDPAAFTRNHPVLRFRQDAAGRTVLALPLPHAAGGSLDLRRREAELILTVGAWRRAIHLPDSLVGRPVERARLAGGELQITFAHGAQPGAHKEDKP